MLTKDLLSIIAVREITVKWKKNPYFINSKRVEITIYEKYVAMRA